MGKFLSIIASLILLVSLSEAQISLNYGTNFASVSAGTTINIKQQGLSFFKITFVPNGSPASCQIQVDISTDGSSWTSAGGVGSTVCTSAGTAMNSSAVATNYVRINVTALTAATSVDVNLTGYVNTPTGGGVSANVNVTNSSLAVAGTAAQGAAASGNPVQIAGVDSAGNIQHLVTTTSGVISIGTAFSAVDAGSNTIATITDQNGTQRNLATVPYLFNGSTWDRQRSASATNMTASNVIGQLLVQEGQALIVNSQPAVSTQASASIAAGGAGVRHVFDHACFSAAATTAPALTNLQFNIRDGATGAGTVLQSFQLAIPASTGTLVAPICTPGHANVVGTANTAMTAEWSALLTNLFETATLYYFNVN